MKKPKTVKTEVEFDATVNRKNVCIRFTRETEFFHDAHYGADADGNRGIPMDFTEDEDPSDISVYDEDTEIWTKFDDLPEGIRDLVSKEIKLYMDKHEAEAPEEPEPDYDDIDD